MRSFFTILYFFSILLVGVAFSQEVEVNLGGHTASQGFSILDDSSKTLFRVRGDGRVGINTIAPEGIIDLIGGVVPTGDALPINIIGQKSLDNGGGKGGDINIFSGDGTLDAGSSGNINISTKYQDQSYPADSTGNINLETGYSGDFSGNITIRTGGAVLTAGDLFLIGGNAEDYGGSVNILAGEAAYGGIEPGNITIKAGVSASNTSPGGKVRIESGQGFNNKGGNVEIIAATGFPNGGDIMINAGDGEELGEGGDIIITPGSAGTDGLVVINGSGTYSGTWTQYSDIRFKKNIKPIKNSLAKLSMLNGITYELRTNEFPEKKFDENQQIGLIAQEVEKVFPELIKTDTEGYKSVAYQNMVAVLIEAIKEQQGEIEELRREVERLKISETADVGFVNSGE